MLMRLTYLVLMLCICQLNYAEEPSQPLSSSNPPHITLGAENSWPPYSDENGQGISTRLIEAAFAKVGITPSFKVLPYSRVLHDLTSGKIEGGYNVARQTSTADKYVFGKEPLLLAKTYWYFMPNQYPHVKTIEDVPNQFKIGTILDYEYGDTYEAQRSRFKEFQLSKQAQIIRMLQQGRLDAGLMSEHEAEFALKELELPLNTLEKRFINHIDEIYLVFSPKYERSAWLAEQFDKGLVALKQSGEYERLAEGN